MKVLKCKKDTAGPLVPSNASLVLELHFDEVQSLVEKTNAKATVKWQYVGVEVSHLSSVACWMLGDAGNRVLSVEGSSFLGVVYAEGSRFILRGIPRDLDEIKSLIG